MLLHVTVLGFKLLARRARICRAVRLATQPWLPRSNVVPAARRPANLQVLAAPQDNVGPDVIEAVSQLEPAVRKRGLNNCS